MRLFRPFRTTLMCAAMICAALFARPAGGVAGAQVAPPAHVPWEAIAVAAGFALDGEAAAWAERAAPEGSWVREAAGYVTELAGPVGMPLALLALGAANPEAGAEAFSAVVYAGVFTLAVKALAGRARPDQGETGFFGPSLDDGRQSFPSGHTAAAFAFAGILGRHYPSLKEEAFAAAAAVGLTRILLDRHWASDVAAGAALGAYAAGAVAEGRWGVIWRW